MGGLGFKELQFDKLNQVSLDKVWRKYSQGDNMTQQQFLNFMAALGNMLGLVLEPKETADIFNSLQKSGTIPYFVFEQNFENWCNQQIEDYSGVEVLKPVVPLTRITKTYQLQIPYDLLIYKKILLKNPDEYDKELNISSSNEKVLSIRNPRLKLAQGASDYIKFKIKTCENAEVFIVITHAATRMAEENLSIKLDVEEKPKTPDRPSSGNINKNKSSWNYNPRRPSPRRNSISDS
jgi:hypothetical protein